jgi:general secretion pathway protein M
VTAGRLLRLARRLLALGLLLVPVAAVWALAIAPALSALEESDRTIAQAAAELARLRTIAGQRPALVAAAAQMRAEVGRGGAFLRAGTEALAGAALQQQLQALLAQQGIGAASMQWQGRRQEGQPGLVSVRLQAATTLGSLVRLLAAIDRSVPLLAVDEITIQAQPGASPAGGAGESPLSVSLECSAAWLPPAPATAKAP